MFEEIRLIKILLASFNDNVNSVIQDYKRQHQEDQKRIKELEEKIQGLEKK